MDFYSIMVCLDDSTHSQERLDFALEFARSRGAYVIGVHISYFPRSAWLIDVEAMVMQAQERMRDVQKTAERSFREALARTGVDGKFIAVTDIETGAAVQLARTVDLVVAGQYEGGIAAAESEVLSVKVLLGAARPVLYVPLEGDKSLAYPNILIAWNDSREAVRAINDAMPFLKSAEQVSVVSVQPLDGRAPDYRRSGKRLLANLARHGVDASYTVIDVAGCQMDADEWLVQQTQRDDVDLLVAGGYGHTRMTEFVLGGVTRSLLHRMEGQVLMSH